MLVLACIIIFPCVPLGTWVSRNLEKCWHRGLRRSLNADANTWNKGRRISSSLWCSISTGLIQMGHWASVWSCCCGHHGCWWILLFVTVVVAAAAAAVVVVVVAAAAAAAVVVVVMVVVLVVVIRMALLVVSLFFSQTCAPELHASLRADGSPDVHKSMSCHFSRETTAESRVECSLRVVVQSVLSLWGGW